MKKLGEKFSIRKQMTVIFAGLILFLLILLVFVNGMFAEWYYVLNKRTDLVSVYKAFRDVQEDNLFRNETEVLNLDRISEKNNVSALLINGSSEILYTNVFDPESLRDQVFAYVLNKNIGRSQTLLDTKEYQISRTRDIRNGADYLELLAKFENSDYLLLRCPLDSIRSNVNISNQFIFYIGVLILGVGIVLVWFFSKRISEPLLELAELSKKMAKLDFNAKYTRGGTDEIGILGESFNTMSD